MDNESMLDLSAFPEELDAMLAFMRAGDGASAPAESSLPAIDWNQFLQLVRHHRVYPQLYAQLREDKLIPADVLQALATDFTGNRLRMLRLAGESERVCRALRDGGLDSLVLKGPALAQELYGDLALRTSKDLDILIRMADIEAAEDMLRQLGYAAESGVPRVFNWKWKVHHISFAHPQTRVQVELHWRLNSDMGREPSFEELWQRRRTSALGDAGICMLGREDLFMYLALHGARHGWFRLRWLADIDRAVRLGGIDWEALESRMRRCGCLHLGGQALVLAASLLGTPLPAGAGPMIAGGRAHALAQRALAFIADERAFSSASESEPLTGSYKRYLFALKTKRQKWFYAVSQLYPSFRDTEALPLPRPLHFLYFPLRPFVWLWRQIKQQA